MEKEKKTEIIILLTIFISLIIGIFTFVHYKIEKPNTYNIIFSDIDSIVKGSPVRFMGINIGYVIKLKRKDDHILCKIRVTKKNVQLPNGTKAKVTFNGLAGSKSIELMPPLTDDSNAKGIVADDALRIHDFVGAVKGLKDICITINNMVQKFDEKQMSKTMKEVLNPEAMEKIDNDMQEIIDKKERQKQNNAVKVLEKVNNFLNRKRG